MVGIKENFRASINSAVGDVVGDDGCTNMDGICKAIAGSGPLEKKKRKENRN
jgi:hypothetical protein